ncbi:MAG: toxin Bro [Bacillales bacterium]|jgi:anti-repressor protein|nr:toxin Bro [Bacillales bacterium]
MIALNDLIKVNELGKATARDLYEFLSLTKGQFSRWAYQHITSNKFAEENIDYEGFDIIVEGNLVRDFYLSIDFAKKLCMISKSQKGEQARNYFIEIEKRYKQQLPQLSQLEILAQSAQILLEQEKAIKQISAAQTKQAEELQSMRDVVALSSTSWRGDSSMLISKMARKLGGNEHIQDLRNESYKLLDNRMGVDLKCRLTNKRRRMADEGICKSKRDNLNHLDVISDDKKLVEGYIAIVKEMAIKYGI